MEAYTQHGETSCLRHSINVSYLSYLYCRDHGWQARAAARAGLLHDLFLYDWHFHAKETGNYFHGLTHPRRALENAQRLFSLTDREKNIILQMCIRDRVGMGVLYLFTLGLFGIGWFVDLIVLLTKPNPY